jgi:hypothetical protein
LFLSDRCYVCHYLSYTKQDDFTFAAFQQLKEKSIDAPLTEKEMASKSEATMEVDYGHTREYVHSVSFPISTAALTALKQLSSGGDNLVQLVCILPLCLPLLLVARYSLLHLRFACYYCASCFDCS